MALKSKFETLVTVFGGSGFLGRHVVRALANRDYRIRVAVRRPELTGYLQPLGRVGQIHAVQANVRFPQSVEAAVRDADVVINLVGILFERGRQRFDAVQAQGAGAVAEAAHAAGARLIHVSAIGADENSVSRLRAIQGGWRAAGTGGATSSHHHAAINRVRSRGRLLQPLRRAGSHLPGAAASRRRPHPISAGVCRRRGGSYRQGGRWQSKAGHDLRVRRAGRAARSRN